ncbi:MAG: hypothetical protein JJU32_11975 [Phormidium sp. BM_Day4_Bin.17]|nr:hypothetical protein [Phormidium sp. BM_Day4_Bin.17]UCJ10510.1 MAG: hypothetical protein JWS08_11625 [Phormidium sp. PBR-2020]
MTGSTERLYQTLERLSGELSQLSEQFEDTYREYIAALANAVRHQLILATYHLCTQGYPEAFVALSFSQRQALQLKIRQLAKQVEPSMLQGFYRATVEVMQEARAATDSPQPRSELAIDPPDEDEESEELGPLSQSDQAALEAFAEEFELPDDVFARVGIAGLTSESGDEDEVPFLETEPPESKAPDWIDLEDAESLPSLSDYEPMSPELIASWQRTVEQKILRVLSQLSQQVNRVLQSRGILPATVPPKLVQAATQVDATADTSSNVPNLLKLLVETEAGDESRSQVAQLLAVRLRLSDIEFADPTLKNWRDRLRKLSSQLVTLGRSYQEKQRQRAIIEAESAWRSSWFEEDD